MSKQTYTKSDLIWTALVYAVLGVVMVNAGGVMG